MWEHLARALHLQELDFLALFDILLLATGIYWVLVLIRGTRAAQAMSGLLALIFLHFVTGPGVVHLRAVHEALGYLLLYLPFAIIVLFQNPIRQALARIGWGPLSVFLQRRTGEPVIEEVALAAVTMASKRYGALIVFERRLGLRAFYETGIALESRVSYDLLLTIFTPPSPLHDGAVIIADNRIKAASCYLPLTTDPTLSHTYGTRHRAAIGITEETDALAVVVSEERGIVSLAENGRIVEDLGARELIERLAEALGNGRPVAAATPGGALADTTHA